MILNNDALAKIHNKMHSKYKNKKHWQKTLCIEGVALTKNVCRKKHRHKNATCNTVNMASVPELEASTGQGNKVLWHCWITH